MPEGLTRAVITFVVSFFLLLATFPMISKIMYVGLNDYLVNALLDQSQIDKAWNASVQVCASIYNTTEDSCAQFLADHGLSKEAYYLDNTVWFPLPMSWWELLFTWRGLSLLLGLSLVFTLIIEAGGGRSI